MLYARTGISAGAGLILTFSISPDAEKRIAFSYQITRSDFIEFSISRANRPELKDRNRKSFFGNFLVWLVVGLGVMALFGKTMRNYVSSTSLLILWAIVVASCLSYLAFRKHFQRRSIQRAVGSRPGATFEGPVDLVLDGTGVECNSEGTHSTMEWRTIRRIEETPTHLFLMMSEVQALIIPKRDLSPELISDVRQYVGAHIGQRG